MCRKQKNRKIIPVTSRNLRLDIAYNGVNYSGWQMQSKDFITVQGIIEHNISRLLNERFTLYGASRTDSGVHALGQVANYFTNTNMSCSDILWRLNKMLPEDIYIKEVSDVDLSFSARRDAKSKHYRYLIWTRTKKPIFCNEQVYYYPRKYDFDKIKKAAKDFIGTHDFSSFGSNRNQEERDTVKTIYDVKVEDQEGLLIIDIFGNSFLYKMVRAMCGTLLEIGQGKEKYLDIKNILEAKNRSQSARNLPGHGLKLIEISY